MMDIFTADVLPEILAFLSFNEKIKLRRVSKKLLHLIDTLKCHQNLVLQKAKEPCDTPTQQFVRYWSYANPNLANQPIREHDVITIKPNQIRPVFAFLKKELFSNVRNLYLDPLFTSYLNGSPHTIDLIQLINTFGRLETLEIGGRMNLQYTSKFYFVCQLDLERLKYFNGQITGRNLILNTPKLASCSINSLENLELIYPLKLTTFEIFYFDFQRLLNYPNSEAAIIKLFDNLEVLTFWAIKAFEDEVLIDLIKALPKLKSLHLFNRRNHAVSPVLQFSKLDLTVLVGKIKKLKLRHLTVFVNGINLVRCFDKSEVFENHHNYYNYEANTGLAVPTLVEESLCLQGESLLKYLKLFMADQENKEKLLQDRLLNYLKIDYFRFIDATKQAAVGQKFLKKFIKVASLSVDGKLEDKERPKFIDFLQFINNSFDNGLDHLTLLNAGLDNDFYGNLHKYCSSLKSLQIRDNASSFESLNFNFLFELKQLSSMNLHFRFYFAFLNDLFQKLKYLRTIRMPYDERFSLKIDKLMVGEVFNGFELVIDPLSIQVRFYDLADEKLENHIKQRIEFPNFTF